MTLAVVSDTGPLIHLAEIDSLELLTAFDRLYVPKTVYGELERGGVPTGLTDVRYELVEADAGRDNADELDAGKSAGLTVAKEYDAVLLTDDLAARESADADGVEVHESVGIIALGHVRGVIDRDEAASKMRNLQRETSLFVTDAVVEHGIQMLDEY